MAIYSTAPRRGVVQPLLALVRASLRPWIHSSRFSLAGASYRCTMPLDKRLCVRRNEDFIAGRRISTAAGLAWLKTEQTEMPWKPILSASSSLRGARSPAATDYILSAGRHDWACHVPDLNHTVVRDFDCDATLQGRYPKLGELKGFCNNMPYSVSLQ